MLHATSPLNPPVVEDDAALPLARERLRVLLQTTMPSVSASTLAALVVLFLLVPDGGFSAVTVGWCVVLLATLGVRLAMRGARTLQAGHEGLPGSVDATRAVEAELKRQHLAFGLHGLAWAGLLPVLMLVPQPEAATGVLFIWTAMVGGAFVTCAYDLRAASFFAWPAGLALAAAMLGAIGPPLPSLAAGAAVFVLITILAGRRAARQFEAELRAGVAGRARYADAQRHAEDAEDARRELAQRNALMQQLLQGTSQGYWFIDVEGRTLDVNPAMCEMLGRSREELLGLGALDVFSGAARERLLHELALRRQGKRGSYEMTIDRPDGSVRHAVNQATPIVSDEGCHIGSIGLWTDVTELKALERGLRTYERVANSVDDMVSMIGPDGCYRLVNDAWCRALGRTREEAIGQPARQLMQGLSTELRWTAFEACQREGRPGVVTMPVRLPDGRDAVLQTQFFPYRDEGEGDGSVILVSRDISHREQDRAAAEVAAESLRGVLDATGDAIYATEPDNRAEPVRFANQQLLDLLGIRDRHPHELRAADLRLASAALYADPEVEQRQAAAIVASGQRHEGLVRLRDGRVVYRRFEPVNVAGRRLRVWSFRDVTAEQRAMSMLHDREAQQRALLDAFPGFISCFDRQLRYTYVNEPLARLARRPACELVGRHVSEVIGRRRAAAFEETMTQVLAGRTMSIEREYTGPDGAITVQMTLAAGTHPRTGDPVLYAFGADISELKRAEQRLRAGERELRALLEAFPGHISSVDPDGRYTYMDAALAGMLGRRADEVPGLRMADVLGPDRARRIELEHEQVRQGRALEVERSYADSRGGQVDLAVRHVAGPPGTDGRRVVYTFSVDITARKRAEQALAAARDEADRANRAKSQFLSHMSHELRTPMNAVVGFVQLLMRDQRPPLAPHQQGYAQQIQRGAQHLLELINEVLDLGRIEAGGLAVELQPVPAAELVSECLALVQESARSHGVMLLPVLTPVLPHGVADPSVVTADRTRLRQVLLNLLSNAIKYNRAGGEVQVRLAREAADIVIEVRDSGPGIPPEAQQRLFVPFERLGAELGKVEGTGIGLALSRRLVEAMQGRLDVDSRVGEGSVFRLSLPAPPHAAAVPAAAATSDSKAPAGAATPGGAGIVTALREVLYIDDNEVNLELVEVVLAQLSSVRLRTASRPEDGLAMAQHEPPHLVLLDLHMPVLSGYEVLALLRAHPATAAVPVVAVSADATPYDLEAARAAGFAAYVTKPLDVDELIATVLRLSQPGQNPALGAT